MGQGDDGRMWAGMSVRERVRTCLDTVVDGTTAVPGEVLGLDRTTIQRIEDDQPVPLAGAYRYFLQLAGGGVGRFLQGSDVFHPQVLGLRDAAQELLTGVGASLGPQDRVILMHQDSQFDFLRGAEEDPEVWSFCEGGLPRRSHERFTDWLRDNAEEQATAWACLAPWSGQS
jgi:hypothetical protein